MLEENKKSYYAVIPANVRYDTNICANAKLLYGEITALCNEKGYCWASNQYFADLYSVNKASISRWVSSLEKNGYINIELVYKENSKEIKHRYIRIVDKVKIKDEDNSNNIDNSNDNNKFRTEIKDIIDYLNEKIGGRYRYNTESTNKLIRAKLNAGFTVNDFKYIIDRKVDDWQGTDFEKYLRPSTLFGNKFEQYLNQKPMVKRFNPIQTISQKFSQDKHDSNEVLRDDNGDMVIF